MTATTKLDTLAFTIGTQFKVPCEYGHKVLFEVKKVIDGNLYSCIDINERGNNPTIHGWSIDSLQYHAERNELQIIREGK